MSTFNEWLHNRDANVFNELFDDKYIPGTKFFETYIGKHHITIRFSDRGLNILENLVRANPKTRFTDQEERSLILDKKLMDWMGNELFHRINIINSSAHRDKDIFISQVRNELLSLFPKAKGAWDAILQRFATRTNRIIINDGNTLRSKSRNSTKPETSSEPEIEIERRPPRTKS